MEFTISVEYLVRTYDENLPVEAVGGATCSKVTQTITNNVTMNLASHKNYTLVLHLGLTSVKFSADVSGWQDDATEQVWLPSNVVSTTATSLALGSSASVNTAGDNTTYAITLTGLTSANNFTASVSADGGSSASLDPTSGTFGGDSKMFTVTLPANDGNARTYTVTITDTTADPDVVTTVTIKRPAVTP